MESLKKGLMSHTADSKKELSTLHTDKEEEAAPVPPVPPTESSSAVQDTENDVETSKPSAAKISPFCYEVSLGTLV